MSRRKVSPFFASSSEAKSVKPKLKAERKEISSPVASTFSRFPTDQLPPEKDRMQVDELRKIKKIEQRTEEWYVARKTMITASDWADALGQGKGGGKEDIILKKCDKGPVFTGNVFTEWGIKYEPVATRMYELRNMTPVYEFGVLRHSVYPFLGASPDGITPAGIMLEIKCPYKRKITGVVPEHYWVQVQGQLEVCDLEMCDFLECKISEYPNQAAYLLDIKRDEFPVFENLKEKYEQGDVFLRTKDGQDKGVILTYFLPDDSKKYVYSELGVSEKEFNRWYEEQKKANVSWGATYISVTYWKFDFFSCVRIKREKKWFEEVCPKLGQVWNEIEHYRKIGCDSILSKKGPIVVDPSEAMIQVALQDQCGLDDLVSGFLSETKSSPPQALPLPTPMSKTDSIKIDIEHLANLDIASQYLPNYLPTEIDPNEKETILRAEIALHVMAKLVRDAVISYSKLKGYHWKKSLPELPSKLKKFHSWMKGIPSLLKDYEEAYKSYLSENTIEKIENTIVFAENWLTKSFPGEADP